MAELRPARLFRSELGLHRRVARARRGGAAGAGSHGSSQPRGRSASRADRGAIAGWAGLVGGLAVAALCVSNAEGQVTSSRIWPAADYTRLTLESKAETRFQTFSVKDPERLVLDLETAEITPALAELERKVAEDDPYIKRLRVARNRPGVIRVVLDLKGEVKPQVFTLTPVGEYGHRLVLDIYPAVAADPLAQLIEQTRQAPTPAARFATIVIDAGHGGEDPGALGRRGTREKDVTLMIARRLKTLVDAEPNMRALLTRDGDYFLPLDGRVEKARKVKADLFVSIHADAYTRPYAKGSSVFALSDRRATSELARLLAKKENESDLIGGVKLDGKDDYVKKTIIDLSQTATIDYSLRLGNAVLARLGAVNSLHKPRVEQASFAVLKSPDVPSILVETAFISNPEEEKRLKDEKYQDRLARALLEGIRDYIARHPPRPSTLALN